ncbi:protein NSP-INTERACTING KINASE 1-like [Zingiber officinale]|uniref:non-specific serine/threonine protein kinase n=1 Tax=Zingiber officinale TaxID=94328 RepID=A0A8J5C3L7_ZINOF|nr:protein NSP-INTERACTING KINASE 1-like [Zingiber officinale]KAG6466119.1 hypothetical protein ZIOFF_076070 [Zingiber officinale]
MRSMEGKNYKFLVFWVHFHWSWVTSTAVLSPEGVNFEVQALMGFKASIEDPHKVLENWDQTSVDPCSWTMITCSSQNLVIGLGTPSQNLSGALSASIGNLTNLEIVLLQNNKISGTIPSEIGKLSKLHTLDLSNNKLYGEIPSSLGNLKGLKYLRLNNNSLSGELPGSLLNITQLDFMDLSYNNLSGPVPRFPGRTFNVVGNALICPTGDEKECYGAIPIPMSFNINNDSPGDQTIQKLKRHTIIRPVAYGLACICFISLALGLLIWCNKRRSQQVFFDANDQHKVICLGNLKRFQFRELQIATNGFSSKNLLGKGGFGNVYKGKLQDRTLVAVKRLNDGNAAGGEIQFKTEVEMISLAIHRHLIRLCGFCMTATEKLLVYPYMSNGSVASRLKARPALDWSTRKRIALGAARGLMYLHEQCDPKIIHRDVKAANILLDDDCEAVVGDFGLAKLLDHRDTHVTTAVRGTVGHIAPEYLSTGQSSEKTDVFGFGILLLELITGSRALEFGKKSTMLDWVKKMHHEKRLNVLVDKELKNYDRIEMEVVAQVALLCTQYQPSHRPKMSEVVRMLEGDCHKAERWEASQRADDQGFKVAEHSTDSYSEITEVSRELEEEAIELSGPR